MEIKERAFSPRAPRSMAGVKSGFTAASSPQHPRLRMKGKPIPVRPSFIIRAGIHTAKFLNQVYNSAEP